MNHALKVARFAEQILKSEGGNPLVVLGAAYLHDIGIHEAEKKHGSPSGHFQEIEGPPIAREILKKLAVDPEIAEEICDIVSHHHSPGENESLNFQIVFESDWLVNIEEEGLSQDRAKIQEIVRKAFKTVTGKRLAEERYLA